MGYYSNFDLEIVSNLEIDVLEIIKDFRNTYDYAEYALNENGDSEQDAKWYDYQSELTDFSKKYPHCLFIMTILGEDGYEHKCYAQNGKTYGVDMVKYYPPFDPDKLEVLEEWLIYIPQNLPA